MCKASSVPSTQNKQNHFLLYYNKCLKEGVVSLPILFKVRDKSLTLKGYVLNRGNCLSIAESITFYPDIMDAVNLTDNSVKDEELAILLRGFANLTELRKVIIKDNDFQSQSIELLAEILNKPFPNNLEELRLVSLRTSPLISS